MPTEASKSTDPKPDHPEIKNAFTPKSKANDTVKPKVKKSKRPPEMLSYGWANNHPTVPENFMKTFNVTVPSDEVFKSTRERLERTDKKKSSKSVEVIQQPETAIKNALQQYLEAKKRLEKLQTIYKSEYQNEYVNWAEPMKRIGHPSKGPAGLPSDYHDKEKRMEYPSEFKNQISVVRETATSPTRIGTTSEIPDNNSLSKRKEAGNYIKTDVAVSPIKSSSVNIQADIPQSPFLNARKVYDQLKDAESPINALEKVEPAGITDAAAMSNKEKRHYYEKPTELQSQLKEAKDHIKLASPTVESKVDSNSKVLMFNIEPPTTWRLAQDLLERAHKRSQNLDTDS